MLTDLLPFVTLHIFLFFFFYLSVSADFWRMCALPVVGEKVTFGII